MEVVRSDNDGLQWQFSELAATVRPEGEEQLVRQSEASQADINKIVARFEKSGILPLTGREGLYLDVSEVGDYHSALEQVRKAEEYFGSLPASSRAMFDNDPAEFLDRVNDPESLELLVEAGVIPKGEVRPIDPPKAPEPAAEKPPAKGAKE